MKHWTYIMIHHSLTKDGQVADWPAIKNYHIKERGWSDIGYHFGVEKIRGIYQVQFGRDLNVAGAHCKEGSMNSLAVGICLVGNFDVEVPCLNALSMLAYGLVVPLMRRFSIPVENIFTHHEYASYKSCPGKLFPMNELKHMCREVL